MKSLGSSFTRSSMSNMSPRFFSATMFTRSLTGSDPEPGTSKAAHLFQGRAVAQFAKHRPICHGNTNSALSGRAATNASKDATRPRQPSCLLPCKGCLQVPVSRLMLCWSSPRPGVGLWLKWHNLHGCFYARCVCVCVRLAQAAAKYGACLVAPTDDKKHL